MSSSRGPALLYGITAAAFCVILAGTLFGPYGLFIDEFYYIACAKRLAWGYVDHPPLSILILATTRAVRGDSILALRLPPALAAAGTVFVAGLVARRLGGGPFAEALAALATATGPVFLLLGTFYSIE
jgi:4-amino-4-deoxy-L-arabinose transferase-like glycosyltransferase